MKIKVSGKGMDVGKSLHDHISTAMEEAMTKYTDRVTSADAVVTKEANQFRVDIHGNLGTHAGVVVRSHALGSDVYATFGSALEKAEKQLRRYKRRISNHQKLSHGGAEAQFDAPLKGVKYVIPADYAENDDEAANPGMVIAEKPTNIATLTVSEAVMRMDLEHLPALLFYNTAHGRLNVVYRREDGNISWVDPTETSVKVA